MERRPRAYDVRMGLWDNTAFFHCDDLARIERALEETFAREKRVATPMPAPRKPGREDPMQYGGADDNPLWAVALLPGVGGWTVVKTAPFELLCETAPAARQPRLAALTQALDADGFQLNLYDGDSLVLLEASRRGEVGASGFCSQSDDPLEWNGLTIGERFEPEFHVIEVAPAVARAVGGAGVERATQTVHELLAGGMVDNRIQVSYLIPHHELLAEGARACFFRAETVH